MAVLKCKMCGGDLNLIADASTAECEFCGSVQTIPKVDNEKKLTLFARANRLRIACEFDKAAGVYESIVADFPEEAESYWGLVLCKYGIEYVDDPATGKKIPTCHRSSFDSIMEDSDFEQALENADIMARRIYREEAKTIEEIRKGIISVSAHEEPYDIFICYKETAENGDRTLDSVLAQDVYDALTDKGYRVFFSRITLEDKLGVEYEPYIFAALNSAKIMLVFGTDYEHFNAVWVKNEWSRYLKLMAKDKGKYLIPCFKGIDAYDMPKEFARLQAQDLGKVGATQDLLRGIGKILPRAYLNIAKPEPSMLQTEVPGTETLLKRGFLFVEDMDWKNADNYFDRVLDLAPECAEAYLGKLMVSLKVCYRKDLGRCNQPFDSNIYYQKILRFGTSVLKDELNGYLKPILEEKLRIEQEARLQKQEISSRLSAIRRRIAPASKLIACGEYHAVGLNLDGTVVSTGNNGSGQCSLSDWCDIVAVCASDKQTTGFKNNGSVVSTGVTHYREYDTSNRGDIIDMRTGYQHVVILKKDGTVTASGANRDNQRNVSDWKNIAAIGVGSRHTVGLKNDGTVIAVGNNSFGQCNVSSWRDIVAICAGDFHTIGLKDDGTVVATGSNKDGQCNVTGWKDIVAVSAGCKHTVGLKSDGRVVAVCSGNTSLLNVVSWQDIVAICAGGSQTIGLKSDGSVVAVGDNSYGQCNVTSWKLFSCLDTLEQERIDARKKAEEDRIRQEREQEEARIRKEREAEEVRIRREQEDAASSKLREQAIIEAAERERKQRKAVLLKEKESLQNELSNLRGLFSSKRRRVLEFYLSDLENELKELE